MNRPRVTALGLAVTVAGTMAISGCSQAEKQQFGVTTPDLPPSLYHMGYLQTQAQKLLDAKLRQEYPPGSGGKFVGTHVTRTSCHRTGAQTASCGFVISNGDTIVYTISISRNGQTFTGVRTG